MIKTETVNKWWDSLTHEQKVKYIDEMDTFDWYKPISVAAISKRQKNDLYQQVHGLKEKRKRIPIGEYWLDSIDF